MRKLQLRIRDERGAVLIIVALVMSTLLILSAGGIMLFTLYGSHREMQKAADQAALAGAAALPPLYPDAVLDNFPLPNTSPVYDFLGSRGLDIPRLTGIVPDPRAVACEYGHESLEPISAKLIQQFGDAPTPTPSTVCSDKRVSPSLQSSAVLDCLSGIVSRLSGELAPLRGLPIVGDQIFNGVLRRVQRLADSIRMAAPAVLSPKMTVDVISGVKPPMMSFITGTNGLQMKATATAERRLKNAVVVPVTNPRGSVADVNLNTALNQLQGPMISGLDTTRDLVRNQVTNRLGLPNCDAVFNELKTDLTSIYNPPTGPAPTARQLVQTSANAAEQAAAATGVAVEQLAGEAFFLIGTDPTNPGPTIGNITGQVVDDLGLSLASRLVVDPAVNAALTLLNPVVRNMHVPIFDVVLVAFHNAGSGSIDKTLLCPSASNPTGPCVTSDLVKARGAFTAVLVK